MAESEFGPGLERIRARRQLSLEVILTAVVLALLVNVFSTSLLNSLDPGSAGRTFWIKWAWFSGIALLTTTSAALLAVLCRKEAESSHVALTMPIRANVHRGELSFLHHPRYDPAAHSNDLFSSCREELAAPFLAAWPGPNPLKDSGFGPGHYCWEAISELVMALVLLLIRNFGESSLTHSAQFYNDLRRLAGHTGRAKLNRSKWPEALKENRFLAGRGVTKIIVPTTARLRYRSFQGGKKKATTIHELSIKTDYGVLTFSLSPYWTILRDQNRARVEFKGNDTETCFLRIPLDLRLEVRAINFSWKGIRFSPKNMQYHYLWFQELAEAARRRMDWGAFLNSRERLANDR